MSIEQIVITARWDEGVEDTDILYYMERPLSSDDAFTSESDLRDYAIDQIGDRYGGAVITVEQKIDGEVTLSTVIDRSNWTLDTVLWDVLKEHFGHRVEIAVYGDPDNPDSITLEDIDTNKVILDAGIYTLCAREDGFA